MKQIILMLILGILLVPGIVQAQELKLSGELWNRWTMENGKAPGDSTDATLRNNFSLERGYVGLEAKFSETIKGRLTVDLFSSDALKDGAGIKLKYAYVDFSRLFPIPEMTTTVGLQKVYFGSIYDWNYSLIGKAPTDEYKLANSSDYGITLNGFIPGGLGEYALGAYNGEGYKNYGSNLKDNTDLSYLANLRLTPVSGLTLGGSVMNNSTEREILLANATANGNYSRQLLWDGLLRAAYGPLDIWVEYTGKDVTFADAFSNKDYSANALCVFPTLKLRSLIGTDLEILGRYDRWDETDNPQNINLMTAVTAGVNYNFMHDESDNPAMQVQLNYTNKTYDEAESAPAYAHGLKDTDTLMLQFKWRFATTIKN